MEPDRWRRIEQLYLAALDKSPADRAQFLEQACRGDTAMRQEVESLLSFAPSADNLLQSAVQEMLSQVARAGSATRMRDVRSVGETASVGRYQLLEKIGEGGMGVVYRAMDPAIGRVVAIKTIVTSDTSGQDAQLRARLVRESQAAGRLSHPNIVAVHDICDEGQTTFIVMEFVNGRTLDQVLRDEPVRLANAEALRIVEECAHALDYAHSRGVVHRDIKPANIMLQPDGSVKIADFGIAKLSQAPVLTQTAIVAGSPHYMAPEQWRGEPATGKADQYALATVAYTMLTGRHLFEGNSLAALAAKTLYEPPPAAADFNSSLNPMVDAVLRKALAKTGDERYSSCGELAAALRLAWSDVPGLVPPAAKHNWMVSALVSALMVILAGLGLFIYQRHFRAQYAPPDAKPVAKTAPPTVAEIKPAQPSVAGTATKRSKLAPALRADPEAMAETALKQQNYAEAIRYFTGSIAAHPTYRAYFGRAGAYRLLNQIEAAVADYSQAILLNPASAAAYRDRAECELRLGLDDPAAKDFDQALRVDPSNPRTWYGRGTIYLKKGGYHKAQECFTRAIELDGNFADAYRNRAEAERKLNDRAASETDLKHARDLEQAKH